MRYTKEQFERQLKAFFSWTSSDTRPASSWYLSLRTFAQQRFNEEYKKEQDAKKQQG